MKKRYKVLLVFLLLPGAFALAPKPELYENYLTSQAVYDANGRLLRLTLAADDIYRLKVPLNKISPLLAQATLLYEDRYFYRHHGINPVALFKAGWTTYIQRSRRVGASTITMQLARLRFNIDSHTLGGKFQQILRALQLEWHYDKHEILEAYLNYAPYGGNIEGIASASLIYFNKSADQLTLHEALTLAVIPQSPSYRSLDKGANNPGLLAARDELIERWIGKHPQAQEQRELFQLPVQARSRSDMPFLAPHFVETLLRQSSDSDLHSTLQLDLQDLLERNTRQYIKSKHILGITNASALLLDYRDMSVRAMLGSVDYFNNSIHGQVNGTLARRSPGSALKPFIYALAIEQGLLHPNSMLKDTQTSFGSYNPENFDRDFSGPLSATQALIRSRNVPAVSIATQLDKPDLYGFLKQARVDLPFDRKHYGLSLVLGGAEVSMRELVELYAMLANHGKLQSLNMRSDISPAQHGHILSAQSSHLTYHMLAQNPRPQQNYQKQWLLQPIDVAWKTGTSYGYRDSWTIGIFGPYVLAVWVGNFDGHGNPALIGRKMAAPLFFKIVDALRAHNPDLIKQKIIEPEGIKHIEVCALSGHIPNKYCPVTRLSGFYPGVSPIKKCDIHRQVYIDKQTGLQACEYDPDTTTKEVYEFWPSDLLSVFKKAGIPRRLPPPYLPHCKTKTLYAHGMKPKISSPYNNVEYFTRTRATKNITDRMPLTAITDADVRYLYWFMNEQYLGKTRSQTPLYWKMRPGKYQLRVIDDHGRSDVRELRVLLTK